MLDEIRNKIFKFMKEKRISLIKKSYINQNEVNNLFFDLKDQNFKETPGNSDLRIISIYKIAGMNCIFSNNKKYDKKKFMELINEISGSKIAYERYVYAKSNENHQRHLLVDEAEKLYSYLAKYLEKVKNMLKK